MKLIVFGATGEVGRKVVVEALDRGHTVTGGAATLKLPDGSGHTVLTAPGFLPDTVRSIAEACAAQQALLDSLPGMRWSHLLPPAMLIDGPRTGAYVRGTDTLVADAQGISQISYADFAVAMIDLVENPDATPLRATVGWHHGSPNTPHAVNQTAPAQKR